MKPATLILIVCIALGSAFLAGLGVWQLNRLAWKEALIERVEAGVKQPPVPLSQIETALEAGEDVEYRPVKVRGTFEHEGEAHYFATHKGQPGYFVYTPLRLADGRALFVNRGFVTMDKKDAATRSGGQVTGTVDIQGLARTAPQEKPNSFVPDNDLAKNVFYWKSLNQMAGRSFDKMEVEFVPLFVDADDAPVPGNAITGGVTRISFPNSHLQYALTWFGLSGALLAVGAAFLWSRRKTAADA